MEKSLFVLCLCHYLRKVLQISLEDFYSAARGGAGRASRHTTPAGLIGKELPGHVIWTELEPENRPAFEPPWTSEQPMFLLFRSAFRFLHRNLFQEPRLPPTPCTFSKGPMAGAPPTPSPSRGVPTRPPTPASLSAV